MPWRIWANWRISCGYWGVTGRPPDCFALKPCNLVGEESVRHKGDLREKSPVLDASDRRRRLRNRNPDHVRDWRRADLRETDQRMAGAIRRPCRIRSAGLATTPARDAARQG